MTGHQSSCTALPPYPDSYPSCDTSHSQDAFIYLFNLPTWTAGQDDGSLPSTSRHARPQDHSEALVVARMARWKHTRLPMNPLEVMPNMVMRPFRSVYEVRGSDDWMWMVDCGYLWMSLLS